MNLAAHLGMTVSELHTRMDSTEFLDWLRLKDEEPWGPYRLDALATKVLAYLVIGPNTADPERTLKEIRLPWVKRKKREMPKLSQEQWIQVLQSWGGKLKEVKKHGTTECQHNEHSVDHAGSTGRTGTEPDRIPG